MVYGWLERRHEPEVAALVGVLLILCAPAAISAATTSSTICSFSLISVSYSCLLMSTSVLYIEFYVFMYMRVALKYILSALI